RCPNAHSGNNSRRQLLVLGLLSVSWRLIPDITLPTIQGSPITTPGRPPLQMLQRENRLPDLAPERRLITPKPFENSVIRPDEESSALARVRSSCARTGRSRQRRTLLRRAQDRVR